MHGHRTGQWRSWGWWGQWYVFDIIKYKGSHIKGSWGDFMQKHEGFNAQACHKAHFCELNDSKQPQRI